LKSSVLSQSVRKMTIGVKSEVNVKKMRQMLFRLFQVFPPTNFHLAKFVLLIEKTLSIYQNV